MLVVDLVPYYASEALYTPPRPVRVHGTGVPRTMKSSEEGRYTLSQTARVAIEKTVLEKRTESEP